jgi:hypothetical protein
MVRMWMLPLVLTAVVVAGLLTVVPLDDASYQCEASPISLFLEPAAENGGEFFFDEAAACNRDARTRVAWTGAIAITGLVVTLGVVVAPRLGSSGPSPGSER